jgi:hypothetical protein
MGSANGGSPKTLPVWDTPFVDEAHERSHAQRLSGPEWGEDHDCRARTTSRAAFGDAHEQRRRVVSLAQCTPPPAGLSTVRKHPNAARDRHLNRIKIWGTCTSLPGSPRRCAILIAASDRRSRPNRQRAQRGPAAIRRRRRPIINAGADDGTIAVPRRQPIKPCPGATTNVRSIPTQSIRNRGPSSNARSFTRKHDGTVASVNDLHRRRANRSIETPSPLVVMPSVGPRCCGRTSLKAGRRPIPHGRRTRSP